MKLGYQGIEGSYSHIAAEKIIDKLKIYDVEFVGLVTSESVYENLVRGKIDIGLCAISNNTAGIVTETEEVINYDKVEKIYEYELKIEHNLYARTNDFVKIVSHSQALAQCKEKIKKIYKNIETQEKKDTAIAAKELRRDEAVLCSTKAGEIYGLNLIHKNMNDNEENATKFMLFKRRNTN
ncbi:MAG: hypothetical protein N4A47_06240 [Clostridia bacterium]|jgi:prephenate dehydratase|nr:hypothetical protein [Clostridia bacterium]